MTTQAQPAKASGEFSIGGKLPVTRLGYGTMQLTGPGVWGDPKDPDEAVRVLRRAVDLGVNFLDTADAYGPVVAEPPGYRFPPDDGLDDRGQGEAEDERPGDLPGHRGSARMVVVRARGLLMRATAAGERWYLRAYSASTAGST